MRLHLVAAAILATTAVARAVWLPAAGNGSTAPADLAYANGTLTKNDSKGLAFWQVATLGNPGGHWHVYCAGCNESVNSCTGARETVSKQAEAHGCFYATNGGPFGMHEPDCMGSMVSDGTIVHNVASRRQVCVGLSKPHVHHDGHEERKWFVGEIHDRNKDHVLPRVENLVCGFGWLVYNGSVIPQHAAEIAPRTALGIDAQGRLITAEADGTEWLKWGQTLQETAEWMLSLGAEYAVNFDGGGSSTTYYTPYGGVQGCPTCVDAPLCCEREVVSITCVKH